MKPILVDSQTTTRVPAVALWMPAPNRMEDTYYSQGKTDPAYCVLRFPMGKERYYRSFQPEDFAMV